MNCEELREHYELYALNIAEEPERGEIREHLNRGCEVCLSGVKQALQIAALLGASAPAATPSSKLRGCGSLPRYPLMRAMPLASDTGPMSWRTTPAMALG